MNGFLGLRFAGEADDEEGNDLVDARSGLTTTLVRVSQLRERLPRLDIVGRREIRDLTIGMVGVLELSAARLRAVSREPREGINRRRSERGLRRRSGSSPIGMRFAVQELMASPGLLEIMMQVRGDRGECQ